MTTVVGLATVQRFRDILGQRLGLSFDAATTVHLCEVLQRRAAARGGSCEAYLEELAVRAPPTEIGALAQELTITETYFFRNIEQFRAFAEVVLADRAWAPVAGRPLRILSAGCASGEEAYTIAMVVRECMPHSSWELSILAVDVNPAMLHKAQTAHYSSWALRATPAEFRERWFRVDGNTFALDETIRRSVRFVERNLADEDPELWRPRTYDAIFFRNVFMYFTPDTGQAVVDRVTGALAPGGVLFLGHAETLRGVSHPLDLRHTHGTFYYQRGEPRPGSSVRRLAAGDPISSAVPSSSSDVPALNAGAATAEDWASVIAAASERIQALTEVSGSSGNHAATVLAASDPAPWDLAVELLRQERFGAALDVVEALPSQVRSRPDVRMLHAALFIQTGQFDRAEEVCRRLLDADALNAGAHYLLASCRESGEDWPAAVAHHQAAAYLDPAFAMPRLRLGLLARGRGDLAAARRELGPALALLSSEDAQRIVLFGGGFVRGTLIALCRAELVACGGTP
jgi:chemotaxis protein methyltransferase CheR